MVKRLFAATPLFVTAIGIGFLGVTTLLAAYQAIETGCLILRSND